MTAESINDSQKHQCEQTALITAKSTNDYQKHSQQLTATKAVEKQRSSYKQHQQKTPAMTQSSSNVNMGQQLQQSKEQWQLQKYTAATSTANECEGITVTSFPHKLETL